METTQLPQLIIAADTLLPIVEQVRAKTALTHVFAVRYADLLPAQPSVVVPAELLAIAPMNVFAMQVTGFGVTFTEALAQQWKALAPHCESFEAAYGLSETHTVDTYMPHDAVRWGTQGKAIPGTEIRILDTDSGRSHWRERCRQRRGCQGICGTQGRTGRRLDRYRELGSRQYGRL